MEACVMNAQILELVQDEIELIAGAILIDPPASPLSNNPNASIEIPQIDNNPPG